MKLFKNPCLHPISIVLLALVMTVTGHPDAWAEKLNIVTTTSDLASIARAVAGDKATVRSICDGKRDPHFLQAKPSYIVMARDADLWIRVGMDLEIGWEQPVLDGARNGGIREGSPGHLDASQKILRLEVPARKVTRAMGGVHPMGNPHYWLDPLNARIIAGTIADRLAELSPAGARAFRKNCRAFERALDERMFGRELVAKVGGSKLWALELKGELLEFLGKKKLGDALGGWLGALHPLRGSEVVTYHRSWVYFMRRFGLSVPVELEPKPGIPPSPSHLAEVIENVKTRKIKTILVEPFYSRKAADLVAAKAGGTVVVCANSVGGQKEATDYFSLIDLIVKRVSAALQAETSAR
ncbi:MAG: metal ABC transporter substrate-binding protein [Planctomycetes bacterium]|nr:metal ABC transporter substrate-binding protein [Planctomycetota bacterium]